MYAFQFRSWIRTERTAVYLPPYYLAQSRIRLKLTNKILNEFTNHRGCYRPIRLSGLIVQPPAQQSFHYRASISHQFKINQAKCSNDSNRYFSVVYRERQCCQPPDQWERGRLRTHQSRPAAVTVTSRAPCATAGCSQHNLCLSAAE